MKTMFLPLFLGALLLIASCGGKKEKLEDPKIDAIITPQLGHYWGISSIAISPDESTIVSGGYDNTIRIWNLNTSDELFVLRSDNAKEPWTNVTSLAYRPDGKQVAAGTEGKFVRLIDPATGTITKQIEADSYSAGLVCYSNDGKMLAVCGYEKKVKIFDPDNGSLIKSFEGHRSSIKGLAFSSDGKLLASSSSDSTAMIFDIATGKTLQKIQLKAAADQCFFSGDGKKLLVNTSQIRNIQIIDVAVGKQSSKIDIYASYIAAMPSGKEFVAVNNSKMLVYDIETSKSTKEFEAGGGSLTVSPKGTYIFLTSSIGIQQIEASSGKRSKYFGLDVKHPQSACFSPSGKYILTHNSHISSSGGPDILCYPVDTSKKFSSYHTAGSGKSIMAFAGKTDIMLSTSNGYYEFSYFDLATGTETKGIKQKFVCPINISEDGKILVAKEYNTDKYAIFNPETGEKVKDLVESKAYHYYSGITADGKYYAIRTMDFFKVFELPGGNEIKSFSKREEFDDVVFIDKMDDGKYVAGDLASGKFSLKDLMTAAEIFRIDVKEMGDVVDAKLSPDKKQIALATKAWNVIVWDIATKSVVKTLQGHKAQVNSVAFSPKGEYIVSTSQDKTTRIWNIADGKELLTLLAVENPVDFYKQTEDFIVIAPNGRIDGTEIAMNKYLVAKKGQERLPVKNYWDKIYTKNLLGRTLGQSFLETEAATK